MLGKTSLLAIRTLMYLAQREPGPPAPPKRIAEELGESPTYLAKVSGLLAKAGIVRAEKGVKGGIRLSRSPSQITLLSVFEACQGTITGSYCQPRADLTGACNFHLAAAELQEAVTGVLARWTLAHLLEKPHGTVERGDGVRCLLANLPRVTTGPEIARSPGGS